MAANRERSGKGGRVGMEMRCATWAGVRRFQVFGRFSYLRHPCHSWGTNVKGIVISLTEAKDGSRTTALCKREGQANSADCKSKTRLPNRPQADQDTPRSVPCD